MGCYTVLNALHQLLAHRRQWHLHLCRRQGDGNLRYYIVDRHGRVVTSTVHRRLGLTLQELLVWMDQQDDCELSNYAHAMREKLLSVS